MMSRSEVHKLRLFDCSQGLFVFFQKVGSELSQTHSLVNYLKVGSLSFLKRQLFAFMFCFLFRTRICYLWSSLFIRRNSVKILDLECSILILRLLRRRTKSEVFLKVVCFVYFFLEI